MTEISIVYAGIVCVYLKDRKLPTKYHHYYRLDEGIANETVEDAEFWFSKKLPGTFSVGSCLRVSVENKKFSSSKYLDHYPDKDKVIKWTMSSRANEEEHRIAHYKARKATQDPLAEIVDDLVDRASDLSWSQRRALLGYILERMLG